eukprot:1507778-Ditylum_brightwellii.AAC.1
MNGSIEAGRSFTSFANRSSITKCPLTLAPFVLRSAIILLGQEVPHHFNTSLRVCTHRHASSCSAELEVAGAVPVIVTSKPFKPVIVVTPMLSGQIPGNLQDMWIGSFCTDEADGAIPVSNMMR